MSLFVKILNSAYGNKNKLLRLVLAIANGTTNIDFYKKAFNAHENFCLRNDDGSIHVAELVIERCGVSYT